MNRQFLKLVGFDSLQSFMAQEPHSSLAHIHPKDQQRYSNHLKANFPKSLTLNLQEWKWHGSYNITYRLQTFDKSAKVVFEWGNLFSLNGRLIVNSFVLSFPPPANFAENLPNSSLPDDVGIRLGNVMTIYPRGQKLLIKDNVVNLTPIEFKLLMILAEEINSPVASEKIYDTRSFTTCSVT